MDKKSHHASEKKSGGLREQNDDLRRAYNESPDEDFRTIAEYFVSGVDPDEIVYLWNLRQQSSRLDSFLGLFRGSLDSVMIRLLTLDEMISRSDQPVWTLSALRHTFSYLSETAFDTVMKKLKDSGLVNYDRELSVYSVTPLGQKVKGLVTSFLKDPSEDSIEVLTGLALAGEFAGTLGEDELKHLLHRLTQIEFEVITAVESASETRILKARERFEYIWKYIEKGTDFINKITSEASVEPQLHRLAQQVGHAQSRLAKATGIFQKVLNDIDRQRVHLGNSGVSTSNLNKYLMGLTPDRLEMLICDVLYNPICPVLIESNLLIDVAEEEIVDKDRLGADQWEVPVLVDSPRESHPEYDIEHLKTLYGDISGVTERVSLANVIPLNSYEESAYRLSMISLIGNARDTKVDNKDEIINTFIGLPAEVQVGDGEELVGRCEVKTISKGNIAMRGNSDK
jgi:hypothetical protein